MEMLREYWRVRTFFERLEEARADEAAVRIVAESDAAIARGEEVALPLDVWDAIEAGESAIKMIRKFRDLTQAELATASGISQGYLAHIESGTKRGSIDALRAIAKALAVPLDVLTE